MIGETPSDEGRAAALASVDALFAASRHDEALPLLIAILEAAPNATDVRRRLAIARWMLGEPAEAIREAQRAVSEDAGDALAEETLSWLLLATEGSDAEALVHARQALALSPHRPRAAALLAAAGLASRNAKDARRGAEALERAEPPQPARAEEVRGHAALQESDWLGGLKHYEAALRLDASLHRALLGIATAQHRQGRRSDAIVTAARAWKENPAHPRSWGCPRAFVSRWLRPGRLAVGVFVSIATASLIAALVWPYALAFVAIAVGGLLATIVWQRGRRAQLPAEALEAHAIDIHEEGGALRDFTVGALATLLPVGAFYALALVIAERRPSTDIVRIGAVVLAVAAVQMVIGARNRRMKEAKSGAELPRDLVLNL